MNPLTKPIDVAAELAAAFDSLTDEHRRKLFIESGITEEVARERRYCAVNFEHDAKFFVDEPSLIPRLPALMIPIFDHGGEQVAHQLRPDHPNGGAKYVSPKRGEMELVLDTHPRILPKLRDKSVDLWITEGILKADSAISRGLCCIGLLGVWMAFKKDAKGRLEALPGWDNIELRERNVYIAFDSDVMTKLPVQSALKRLRAFLMGRGAFVHVARLPAAANGKKVGLDDYFVAGSTVDDLYELAKQAAPAANVEPMIADLNAKYALLTRAHYYVEEGLDQFGHATFVPHTLAELKNIHANKLVAHNDGRANPIDLWNKHPKRREYTFMDLLPGKSQSECGNVLNMWRGWNVEPQAGSCDLILVHIRSRIANGDDAICDKVLDLLAYHVQNPLEKIRIALVLRSKMGGTGKGLFSEYLQRIYGPHFVRAESKRSVVGQFNAHMAQALMVYVDEATFGGDVQAANVLKTLISEPTRDLEHKGKDVIRVRNLAMLIIAGNASHLVHVEGGDRRHFVLDVKEERMPAAESKALIAEMNGEGAGAFLRFLMDRKLPADYSHDDVPETAARTEAKMLSAPALERFTHGFLHGGRVSVRTDDGDPQQLLWPVDDGDFLRKDEWYDAFQQWCAKRRIAYVPDRSVFFKELGVAKRGLGLYLRPVRPGGRGAQFAAAIVPGLAAARATFADSCHLGDSAWDDAITIEDQTAMIGEAGEGDGDE